MHSRGTLIVQLLVIGLCAFAATEWVINFPYPSPLIKPLLPPKLRWSEAQVEQWVEAGTFNNSFLEYFARDPVRNVPSGMNMVSPADGIVQNITVHDGITYLVIGLSFWDVHVVRTPLPGVVTDVAQEGTYFGRYESRAELQELFLRGKAAPVQQIVTLETNQGTVKVRLITSYWASRLKVWVHSGERLEKGQRIGRILLGSTVVAEFPGTVRLLVERGQRVVGGETIIVEDRAAE